MLRSLTRLGLFRGVLGGSRRWLVLGALAVGSRTIARMARRQPDVVYSEPLRPGQSLVVTHLDSHG